MPGMGRPDSWWKIYEALRREHYTKEESARMAWRQYKLSYKKRTGRAWKSKHAR